MKRVINYRKIESDMSIAMRGEVAVANNQAWLDKVWYLKDAPRQFIVEMSQLLNPVTFAPVRAQSSQCYLSPRLFFRHALFYCTAIVTRMLVPRDPHLHARRRR